MIVRNRVLASYSLETMVVCALWKADKDIDVRNSIPVPIVS